MKARGFLQAERILPALKLSGRRALNAIKLWRRDLIDAATDRKTALAQPTARERQDDLLGFYRSYETLVDTICDAARAGANEELERRYQRSKLAFHSDYGRVHPYVVAYLRYLPEDAGLGLKFMGRASDPFEALVAPPDLRDLLAADQGDMIPRIDRTRQALMLYAEHLRQLIATQSQGKRR